MYAVVWRLRLNFTELKFSVAAVLRASNSAGQANCLPGKESYYFKWELMFSTVLGWHV